MNFCWISLNFVQIFSGFPQNTAFFWKFQKNAAKSQFSGAKVCMYQLPGTPPSPRPRTLFQSFPVFCSGGITKVEEVVDEADAKEEEASDGLDSPRGRY